MTPTTMTPTDRRILRELAERLEQQAVLIPYTRRCDRLDNEVYVIRKALRQIEEKPPLPLELQRLGELFALVRGEGDPSPAEQQLADRTTE